MPSLVEELQRAVIDEKISLSSILLKVRLAASKLGLTSVEEWIQKETQGYLTGIELPSYRIVGGTPMAMNPYRGPIPIQGAAELIKVISEVKVRQSIGEIEHMLSDAQSNLISMSFPPGPREWLRSKLVYPFEVYIDIPTSSLFGIVMAVRSEVLKWTLELEKKEIIGSNFTFSATEKQAAAAMTTTNLTVYGGFAGFVGNNNSTGALSNQDLTKLADLIKDIAVQSRKYSDQLTDENLSRQELEKFVNDLQGASLDQKGVPLIRNIMTSFLDSLTKTEGSIVAQGLSHLIHQALSLMT